MFSVAILLASSACGSSEATAPDAGTSGLDEVAFAVADSIVTGDYYTLLEMMEPDSKARWESAFGGPLSPSGLNEGWTPSQEATIKDFGYETEAVSTDEVRVLYSGSGCGPWGISFEATSGEVSAGEKFDSGPMDGQPEETCVSLADAAAAFGPIHFVRVGEEWRLKTPGKP